MYGVPKRMKRVNSDWSRCEYCWMAMFFTTGGSWWWSPIRMTRFSRLCPSSWRCRRLVGHGQGLREHESGREQNASAAPRQLTSHPHPAFGILGPGAVLPIVASPC